MPTIAEGNYSLSLTAPSPLASSSLSIEFVVPGTPNGLAESEQPT